MTLSLRNDPSQQLITFYLPREDADRLLGRANLRGWSRAELLRRLVSSFLSVPSHADDTGR